MKGDDIVKVAIERMHRAVAADQNNREAALDDVKFLTGDQWPEDDRRAREAAGKPVVTINRLPQFVRQVTGDIRALDPAIRVIPSDDAASEDVAEVHAGLIRNIEYRSSASSCYEFAGECAAQSGIGYFRIIADYESPDSFNQELWIKRVANPFAVYIDPDAVEPTRSDAMFAFLTETLSEEDFREQYPGKATVDFDRDDITEGLEHWRDGNDVVVAEYYWKEAKEVTLTLLPDGSTTMGKVPEGMPVATRQSTVHQVKWAKLSGREVLEGPLDVPCSYIPIIAVTGEEINVGGEIVRTSVIRHAKDPQQLYNFWSSVDAEMTALQPKAPYLVTPKQVAKLETFWNEANIKNRPYLPYNPDASAPPPMRVPPPVPSSAITQGMMKATEDMKATTGIFDAGLGNVSNETSGVAIRQRQMESDISNSVYTDNLAKAIEHAGRILVDMIPKIYDTARKVQVTKEDGTDELVPVNGMIMSAEGPMPINPLGQGKYAVRVAVGPNYSTRRQEVADSMMQFVQSFPPAAQIAGDLIAKAMDWPDSDKLAERMRRVLPPNVLDPEDMTPEEQQQMQAAQQDRAMQAQAAQQRFMIGLQKEQAEAVEAGHDAEKAKFEVMDAQMELAAKNGQLSAVIQAAVQQALMQALTPTQ